MNFRWTRVVAVGALGLAAGGAMGCAQERDPINRVQPDALDKSFFVGQDLASDDDNPEFYANGTLLDIGFGAAQDGLFTGFYSTDLSVIRWEITEEYLIGRLAYERIEGSDGKGAGSKINDGQVLYVFKIASHFDIRRDYNPSTGEEINVIVENTSDQAWYQRKYMRVDWSENLQNDAYDFDTGALYGLFFGVEYEPLAYYINDPASEHKPNFETNDGYFDITTRAYAKPGMIDLSHLGWGLDSIPACFLDGDFSGGVAPAANCNPHEITVRHSFWKKQDHDYEPQDWDGFRFQAYGAFTKERFGFARNYGMSDDLWRRFISRYNIWERSHYYADPDNMTGAIECYTPDTTPAGADPKRDGDDVNAANGTHDECEAAGAGSRCDIYSQKCTLPYAQREIRPIVWYYTDSSLPTFYESTNWAAQEWNVAMKNAVAAARNAECYRTLGQTAGGGDCDVAFPVVHGQMTQLRDLVEIQKEVDYCLAQAGTWDDATCASTVDTMLQQRGYVPDSYDYIALAHVAKMPRSVVLCHSPVEAGDHPLCAEGKKRLPPDVTAADCYYARKGEATPAVQAACAPYKGSAEDEGGAYRVRIGDVRHHLVNVIESPETPSPWGFGPTYADPMTGEGISASINVWAYPTDLISQQTVDIARFIAGELAVEEVTEGTYITDWVKAADLSNNGGALGHMTAAQRAERVASAYEASARDLETGAKAEWAAKPTVDQNVARKLQELVGRVRADALETGTFAPKYAQRLAAARGTATEAELTTDAMMEFAGVDQLGGTAALNYASPLRGNINPTLRRQLHQIRENALAARGACMLDADTFAPSPTAMIGLTRILQEKFGKFNPGDDRAAQNARAERMRHYLAERMHYAVIIHEMGHTFGYRHNFVSSSSAFNYRPQYWQLRTRNGQVTQACTDLAMGQDAEDCIGPRYYDAITENETDNLIGMFSHSSVMDYAGDYTQDLLGLGAYDFAAAKMFYGDTATMFADEDMKYTQQVPKGQALTEGLLDNFGGIIGYNYDAPRPSLQVQGAFEPIHYTQLHNEYQLINSCGPVDVTEAGEADGTMTYESATFKPSYWDEETMGKWHPVVDGLIVKVDGQYSRCFQRRVANRSWESLRFPNVDGFYRGGPAISPADDLTRYPYAFATDRWADLGNLSVYRHDIGADPYELFNFFITEQEVMHIFNDYRRNRQQFSVRGAANRILTRYNEKMRDAAKGMTLIYNNIKQVALDGGDDPDQLWKLYVDVFGWTDNMTASTLAFDHFARQMQRPQAGPHRTNPTDSVLEFDDFQAPNVLIPNGVQGFWQDVGIGGKPVENALAEDKGEYNAEFTVNAGSYYDKNYTTMLLTESVDNFISDSLDDFTDPRYRAVSIADLFPDGYRRWLSNNLTDDRQIKGARMVGLNAISPDVRADLFPNYPLGFTSWTGDQPSVCFPNSGTSICSTYDSNGQLIDPLLPAATIAIDPQIGWEQQKFLIAWTLVYLPENQKEVWLDMMNIWNVGEDSDPGFTNRIELHIPNGDVYVARTYGTEEICFETCKTVQRGIGARILEYANQLLAQGYANTPVVTPGATWYEPTYSNGAPVVTNAGAAEHLADFISVPNFMRHAMRDFHMASPSQKGIY